MWYLKVSSSLLIAVALICMIQNVISLTIDPKATEDQWSTLASSTDQNDLKKISKLCKVSLNNFNEKLENTKIIANKKLPEPNKTTEDIANLVSDIKNQVKNASADLVNVRKLVQKTALRFRDTFKSLLSFTELDSESVNKELESIKKTTVDSKKPLVNRVIRSFGNRYDLNKLANNVLEVSSDREKLKNNYNEKKKIAKKEFNSLWNSLSNHSKTVNDNALKALDTFFEGMKSVKSVKKKVKALGEDALNEIKVEDDIIKLKNAVELAKALKLKFEDEWNLDSGELTYSEEQKKPNTKKTDDDQSDVQEKEEDKSNENIPTNDLEPDLPSTEQVPIENDKSNVIPPTQAEIEELPIMDNHQTSDKVVSATEETQLPLDRKNKDVTKIIQPTISEKEHDPKEHNVSDAIDSPVEDNQSILNTENKDKTAIIKPQVLNNYQNSTDDDDSNSDSSIKQTSFNPDINNTEVLNTPLKDSIDDKRINKITSREKTLILPWEKLIQLDNLRVSQQSMKCENLLNNVTPDFDIIKKAAKNSIQVTKSYKNLQNIENETVKQFYDKMVDTNTKLCDYLVNAADDVCAKVTPINKRYETKFKNDPNIKRIKYLLGKQYDPNQYILKVLDDANHKNGIGGMKKTTYYKMLAVAHNLNHETKEMENAALYAMNKIYEGKLAATNLQTNFNKEKASKACYIRNILLEKENEDEKKNKEENKEKIKESINEDTNTEPLKPDVNLDSVDAIQPSTVNDDNEPIINNDEDTKTLSEPNEFTDLNNQKENADETNIEDSKNKKGSMEQGTQEPNESSSIPQDKGNESEEEDDINSNKSGEKKSNDAPESEVLNNADNEYDTETPEHLETEKAASDEENDEGINKSIKPKVKRYRKRIDPKDGKEITEEYETSEEEDDINSNKSGEIKPNEAPESEVLNNADNEHDTETPEHLETEKAASDEENDEGINKSIKPKVKRYRKRIDPKDGKELTEEYETSEEEDDINSNKSGEIKPNEAPESEVLNNADNEHDTETPEHLETEKAASDEENDEGINKSIKPKVKRYRKRIDPKDGKELTEEYETSEEEDDINSNKSGEIQPNDAPESEVLNNADNEHNTETPEHLETEKAASDEENDEGINKSIKPKVKRYRKRIDPKDGKEITEEYETSEEEDDINSNKSGEIQPNDAPESEVLNNADNEHDTETPEHLETEKAASDEENDEGINKSIKPKVKRYRKRIDPKDGKEITEEYETSEEEDDINSNKSGEIKPNEAPESELLGNADNEHDTETPEHLETEKAASDEENDEGINKSIKPKVKRYRKRIDPKDGKEITEEYETSEEEDDINSNKSGEIQPNDAPESEVLNNADNEHDTETPEHLETEKAASDEENDEGINKSIKPKVKRYRKRIDPKDGKEITEEYETSEEEDDINSNKSGEIQPNDAPESEVLNNADNEHDTETPEHLETEKAASDEENDEGINKSIKPKVKRYRKRIDPKDGKEITEEYETSEEEDDINSNKSGEIKPNEAPESELLGNADNEHDTEKPEHLETEKAASDEENDEGINKSIKPKVKRYRKRIDPKDGKEITEEYETSEEEDDINSNKSGEIQPNDAPESEVLNNADNEHDTETPEHLETEKAASDEENDEGINKSIKPKVKRYRKRIDPKDGKEITEEYETSEEEDDINSNKSGEIKPNEAPESELLGNADNEHDTEKPEHLETEKAASDEENDEGINKSIKPKVKRYRKRIDPKDGKEITEEYETSEEEDDINSNKSGEIQPNDAPESEVLNNADNEHDTEKPEHLETEKAASDEENDEGINKSIKPKVKRYRKRIDPKDGKEITEEYETSEEEDDINSNKSGEIQPNDAPESEVLNNADNEHDTETPEHLETEKAASDEENDEGINKSIKPKVKRYRKRIDPKDGKEITEEYETSEEEDDINSNKSGEIQPNDAPESEVLNNADNEHDTETPEHLETEKAASDEENDEGINKSIKPKVKRYRKRIDPKDGKEITEEYETSEEENDINSNKSGEIQPNDAPESEVLNNADNEHDTETPEHLETEKAASDEENDEGINKSIKPKVKRYRKRIDPKDGKEITEEYETSEEEDDINSNKSGEIQPNDAPESEVLNNADNEHDTETPDHLETEKAASDEEENENKSNEDNVADTNPDNITKETVELDDNENLNSVEGAELKSIYNDNIIPAADSMGEDSSSVESSYEEPNINDSNNNPKNNNEQYNSDDQLNKISKGHRKRKDPKNGQEITNEYDPVEKHDGESEGESAEHNHKDQESEIQEYEDMPENDETPDHNQAKKRELIDENEPEKNSSEDINKSNDTNEKNDEGSQPNKKMRRHRKRRGPKDGQEVSEEDGPVSSKNIDTPTGEPDGELTDYESETPEYEDISKNEEISENDETPEHNQANEHELIDENEPEKTSSEDINKSNDTNEQNDEGSQPNKKMRRHRKRRGPKDGQEVSEEDGPESSKNIDTPTGEPDGELTDHESETPEYENISKNEEISENDEIPEHNQANEHELIDENEPEKTSSEDINKSNDTNEQNDEGSQPNKKMRRHRKRRGPKDGQEVSEEDGPLSIKNIDTPTGEPDGELTDHESETPEYEDISKNEEISENDETPEHNQANERELIDENEPEKTSSEDINKSNDTNEQNDEGSQPNKKMRRHRKRRGPKDGQEVSEEDGPESSKNIDTPTGEPDGELTDHESETPEYKDISKNEEISENDETPEHNQANERELIDENEPEKTSSEDINKSNDTNEQNDEGSQPNKKMRRHRKRRGPKDGQEVSEEDGPESSKNIDTPTGEPDGELTDHESETPEYDGISENEDMPKNDETLEHNQAKKRELIDENEPEKTSSEDINKSNDTNEQNDEGSQPNKKMRRHRKRRGPKDGQEVSEEDGPVSSKNIDTPTGEPDGELTDHESETPEYEDISKNEEISENDETPEHNQANEHELIDENEPEKTSSEDINKSNDTNEQNDEGSQPNKKMRRHRKRRGPKDGQEVSEEDGPLSSKNIDTPTGEPDGELTDHESETPEYENISKNEEISENDEIPEHNQANEHELIDENEPEKTSSEDINKSNDTNEQNDEGNQPNKKMRRHRKRRGPKDDQEVSEEDGPESSKNIDTPTGEPDGELTDHESETPEYKDISKNEEISENDETPEHNQANERELIDENEPEKTSSEDINKSNDTNEQNDEGNQPNKKMRRHRKRRGPKDDQEVSEDYDPEEEQEDNSPMVGKNIGNSEGESIDHPETDNELETPEYDGFPENGEIPENGETPEYSQSNTEMDDHEPDRKSNEEKDIPKEIVEHNNADNQPNKKIRRHRKRKDPLHSHEISEEYETIEDDDDEKNKLETPNMASYDQFDNQISSPNNENNAFDENNLVNPPKHKPKRSRNQKNSEYDYEMSEEYDSFEEYDEEAKLKKHTFWPEINNENRDFNNNVIPNIEENNEAEPESSEYPENAVPVASSTNNFDKTMNVAKPLQRQIRRHRKSRQPDSVIENHNEPVFVTGENMENYPVKNPDQRNNDRRIPYDNNQEELPKIRSSEVTDIDNEIEQPELSEYPENSDLEPEVSSPNDVDETINVVKPRPRKLRRHRKSRNPKSLNENENEPEVVNDYNNVQEELPETGNGETTDINNEMEQPETSEYPENSNVESEVSSPNDVNETINVAKPRPRKLRRHRKSRNPKSLNENENEPEVVNDYNNVQEELPETGNGETTDINNEMEQPESSEYPENSNVEPKVSSPNDVNETINVAKPRPRKLRRHRKSSQPKTLNENENEPEIVNDYNNVQEELPETGSGETTDINNEMEQPELSEYPENSNVEPEVSSPNDVNETINVAKPRPRKLRRHRKSRQPKTLNENENEPEVVKDDNNVQEEQPETGSGETTDINNEMEQPELSEYPENSNVEPEVSSPNGVNESINVAKPRPRKLRRHRKSRQPKTLNENENEPEVVKDDNNVQEELPETGSGETTDINNEMEQPELSEYPENSIVEPEVSSPNDVNETINVAKPRPRKLRRHRKSRQPKTVHENYNETEDPKRIPTQNNEHVNYEKDPGDNEKTANLNDTDGKMNSKQPRRKKHVRRKKIPTTVDEITPNSLDTENRSIQNDVKSVENPETQPNGAGRNQKKKRRLRRIRTYMVNKATNERIPINDQTYSTTDGLPDTPKNKLEATEIKDFDDPDSNEDNDDYSSFLFKEYNSDQCKRDAYDRFKKVTSQDAKQIAYRSVLDTSEMRSNMLATLKNAIGNVKVSKTLNDVDQSLRTVSYSLKTGLKQTVSDLVTKVIPLAKDFLKTAENLKELYKNGPQSTHKMISNILENESTVPDSAKDILKLISPQFDVDELINNIFEKPSNTKSLKEKKAKAQRKLIGLSKHMDTAISNIDCFVLSAMSAVGIGADTLKLLKSGRVIMSDKHPRSKALRDAVGIIKSGKKIRNNDVGFAPTLTPPDGFNESDEDDDDEDPDQVAQKNEEFLKTVPDLDDNIPVPKKVPNRRQSLGVIVVHPDKQIEYKEVTDTSQLKKFVGDQTKKYKLQSKNKHPKFLKLNSKKLIDSMVADVKKKAERNGMSKKEMVEEIIKNLNSS